MQTYTVQPGDTLYGISKQYGVSTTDIKNTNNLKNNDIIVGQTLLIPTTETTSLYIVKKGDSLYSIAKTYNVSLTDLRTLNHLNNDILTISQEIRIPIGMEPSYTNYTVKKGDSLYSIANTYKTIVNEIKNINSLTSNLLNIGQVLKIPTTEQTPSTPTTTYQTYTVKSGDSLYKIANLYNMTVDELMTLNNLKTTSLSIGQQLKVESNNISAGTGEILECYGSSYQAPTYQTYTVKKGDSLYIIANKNNTTVQNLIKLNDLKTNNLSIGQVLKIKEII